MGNKQNSSSQATVLKEKDKHVSIPQTKETKIKNILDRNHFDFLYVVGRGGFGKVKLLNTSINQIFNNSTEI